MEIYEKESPLGRGFYVDVKNPVEVTIAKYRSDLIAGFWPAKEAVPTGSMKDDILHYALLGEDEKNYIRSTLILFLITDDYVDEIIEHNFLDRVKNRIWHGYETQKKANEDVHSQTYRLLLEALEPNMVDTYAQRVYEDYSFITDKLEFCNRHLTKKSRLAHSVFIMAILEYIFFSTSFATIFWYKSQNKLPGIAYANEMIARDEGTHSEFDVFIYRTLEHPLSVEEATQIMREAVDIECKFVETITPSRLGMNRDMMCNYARYRADDLMIEMGYPPIYDIKELPLSFMADFGIRRKVDFFRKKENQYQAYNNEIFVRIEEHGLIKNDEID